MSEQLQFQQWLCFQIEDETYAHPVSLLNHDEMMPTDRNSAHSPVKTTINHNDQLLILTDFEHCINRLENYE